jgi:hypothetical protein
MTNTVKYLSQFLTPLLLFVLYFIFNFYDPGRTVLNSLHFKAFLSSEFKFTTTHRKHKLRYCYEDVLNHVSMQATCADAAVPTTHSPL